MEELVDEGVTTNIGVSNFQGSLLVDLLRYARIRPQALQIEIHPYLTQVPLVKFAQQQQIAVTGYSSLGPASYIELSMDRGAPSLLEHEVVGKIATAHNKSTWLQQCQYMALHLTLPQHLRRSFCVGETSQYDLYCMVLNCGFTGQRSSISQLFRR